MKYRILTLNKKVIRDFALERNKLLLKSDLQWVLFVDSDELITGRLKKEINNLTSKPSVQAFYVNRRTYFLGEFVGRDKIIRLVKKGSGKWKRIVHETYQTKLPVSTLKNNLKHNTANDLRSYIQKMNNYSTLHAQANVKEGKTVNILKIVFYPIIKFFYEYFKSRHLVFSIMLSFHSFLSWSKQFIKTGK